MGMFGMERVSSRRLGISPAYEIGNTGIVAAIFWQTYYFIDDTAENEWRVVYETAACADGGAAD